MPVPERLDRSIEAIPVSLARLQGYCGAPPEFPIGTLEFIEGPAIASGIPATGEGVDWCPVRRGCVTQVHGQLPATKDALEKRFSAIFGKPEDGNTVRPFRCIRMLRAAPSHALQIHGDFSNAA